jgi:hypothetical protein
MTIDLDKLEAMARKASQGEWVFYMPNPAAILALIAEVRALRTRLEIDPRHSYDGIDCRDETIRQLEDEVRALREDAARYQWIRDPNNSWGPIFAEPITWNGGAWARLGSRYVYQHLDQAIDAARKEKA